MNQDTTNNQIMNNEDNSQNNTDNMIIPNQNSSTVNQSIQLAAQLRINGYLDLSLQIYQDLIQILPNDHSIMAMKALTLLRSQDFKKSIQCINKAIQLASHNQNISNYLVFKGHVYYAWKKYNKAFIAYTQIILKRFQVGKHKLSQLYYCKGLCLMAQGFPKRAMHQFQQSIIRNFSNRQAHMMKANSLFLLKQYKQAIRHFNSAVTYGLGENIDLLTIKGLSHYHLQQLEKAKICFQNSIDLDQANTKHLKLYLTLISLKQCRQF